MKKVLALILAGALAVGTYTIAFAAPPTEAPSTMSVEQDGKNHNVYVFGTALALVAEDGSVDISSIGPAGRIDVMVDGVVIKNVASIDIPAGQKTKMALEKDSIIVKNVSAKDGDAIKKQIEEAYAAGAESVDLGIFAEDVAAYKVNPDGTVEDADGAVVPAVIPGASVSSVDVAAESFKELMQEIIAEDEAKAAAESAPAPAPISSSSDDSSSSSDDSGSKATTAPAGNPTPTPETGKTDPTPTPETGKTDPTPTPETGKTDPTPTPETQQGQEGT